MRTITLKFMILALVLPVCNYVFADSVPDQGTVNMNTMTVPELEKAGDLAREQKDYDLAIQYFQAALRKDGKNAVLYNKLGMSELKRDNLSVARLNFEKAAKRNSKYAEAINNVGAVYYMQKNYGSAAKYFKKAVALDETSATFHINLGAAWFSQKKMDRAIAEYSRAMELDPNALLENSRIGVTARISSPEERAQYAYLLAKLYAQRGNLAECLICLKKAKEDGYRNLANVYKDREFAKMRENPQLQEVVPRPKAK